MSTIYTTIIESTITLKSSSLKPSVESSHSDGLVKRFTRIQDEQLAIFTSKQPGEENQDPDKV